MEKTIKTVIHIWEESANKNDSKKSQNNGNPCFLEILKTISKYKNGLADFTPPETGGRGRNRDDSHAKEELYLSHLVEELYKNRGCEYTSVMREEFSRGIKNGLSGKTDLFEPYLGKRWIDIFSALDAELGIFSKGGCDFSDFRKNYVSLLSKLNNKRIIPVYTRWLCDIAAMYTVYINETSAYYDRLNNRLISAQRDGLVYDAYRTVCAENGVDDEGFRKLCNDLICSIKEEVVFSSALCKDVTDQLINGAINAINDKETGKNIKKAINIENEPCEPDDEEKKKIKQQAHKIAREILKNGFKEIKKSISADVKKCFAVFSERLNYSFDEDEKDMSSRLANVTRVKYKELSQPLWTVIKRLVELKKPDDEVYILLYNEVWSTLNDMKKMLDKEADVGLSFCCVHQFKPAVPTDGITDYVDHIMSSCGKEKIVECEERLSKYVYENHSDFVYVLRSPKTRYSRNYSIIREALGPLRSYMNKPEIEINVDAIDAFTKADYSKKDELISALEASLVEGFSVDVPEEMFTSFVEFLIGEDLVFTDDYSRLIFNPKNGNLNNERELLDFVEGTVRALRTLIMLCMISENYESGRSSYDISAPSKLVREINSCMEHFGFASLSPYDRESDTVDSCIRQCIYEMDEMDKNAEPEK